MMAEMPIIDPDFEPQSRPRSCTWPLNRPNIGTQSQQHESDVGIKLEATIEECGSQEQIMTEANGRSSDMINMIKHETNNDSIGTLSLGGFPTNDYTNVLLGSPSDNLVSDLSNILCQSSTPSSSNVNEYASKSTTAQTSIFGLVKSKSQNCQDENLCDVISPVSDIGLPSVVSNASTTAKAKSSTRKNAWGNQSYADLITQGIESSQDKRLTLAQIYDWMVKNVPYFKDKGDSNSSAGWKNSIRHNLSLHSKFKRIQNEGTGKSSWWVINYDAKPGKSPRRRATSMDTSNTKICGSRRHALMKKKELLKKEKSKNDGSLWRKSPNSDASQEFEQRNKSFTNEFRNRTSSNASSIGGRVSPPRSYLTQDLEDDGPPPLSPLSSSYTPTNTFGDLFGAHPEGFSLVDSLDTLNSSSDPLQSELLDSIAGMEMINPSSPINQCQNNALNSASNEKTNMYLNTIGNTSQGAPTPSVNKAVLSSPNLASLLQGTSSASNLLVSSNTSVVNQVDPSNGVSRVRAYTMPLQTTHKYNIPQPSQKPMVGEMFSQDSLFSTYKTDSAVSTPNVYMNSMTCQQFHPFAELQSIPPNSNLPHNESNVGLSSSTNEHKTLYQLLGNSTSANKVSCMQQNGPCLSPLTQQPGNISVHRNHRHHGIDNQIGLQNFPSQYDKESSFMDGSEETRPQNSESNLLQMNQRKFPSDIDLDNQDLFDPGSSLDFEQMLQDMDVATTEPFGMEFGSYGFFQEQGSGNISSGDLDNTMDTSTCNVNKPNNVGNLQSYSFPGAHIGTSNVNMSGNPQQRQFQPQHYNRQPTAGFTGITYVGGNSPDVMIDAHPNSMGVARVGTSGGAIMTGNSFEQQFIQSHPSVRAESAISSMRPYRM